MATAISRMGCPFAFASAIALSTSGRSCSDRESVELAKSQLPAESITIAVSFPPPRTVTLVPIFFSIKSPATALPKVTLTSDPMTSTLA